MLKSTYKMESIKLDVNATMPASNCFNEFKSTQDQKINESQLPKVNDKVSIRIFSATSKLTVYNEEDPRYAAWKHSLKTILENTVPQKNNVVKLKYHNELILE